MPTKSETKRRAERLGRVNRRCIVKEKSIKRMEKKATQCRENREEQRGERWSIDKKHKENSERTRLFFLQSHIYFHV